VFLKIETWTGACRAHAGIVGFVEHDGLEPLC